MAKKKVMKIVSVPTLKEVEVTTCDICGKDVGDYHWWMSMRKLIHLCYGVLKHQTAYQRDYLLVE